jgi:hypothetical protein
MSVGLHPPSLKQISESIATSVVGLPVVLQQTEAQTSVGFVCQSSMQTIIQRITTSVPTATG